MSSNATEYPPNVQYIVDHPEKIFGAWFCASFPLLDGSGR